jgi:hypothetical protein
MEKVTPIVKVQKNIIEIKNPTPHIALMIRLKLLIKTINVFCLFFGVITIFRFYLMKQNHKFQI